MIKIAALLVFARLLVAPAFGQSFRTVRHTLLARDLVRQGYENVVARTSESITLVQVEDAKNRYPTDGFRDVVGRTSRLLPAANTKVVLVAQKYGVPMVVFENTNFTGYAGKSRGNPVRLPQLAASPNADALVWNMRRYPAYNSSRFKTDLLFHPDVRMRFGNYNHPFETQLNIVPEIQTLLYNGLVVSASVIVPVYNEFDTLEKYVRLGPTTLNYLARFKHDIFFYAAGGFFRGNRYGLEAGLKKYFFAGALTLDARFGYSGYAVMDRGKFKYDYLRDLTGSISATCFLRPYRLFAAIGIHRFVYQDVGPRFDLYRFFGEFRFGLWSLSSNGEFNGGFSFSVPLPPRHYNPRGHARARVANYFDMTYQGKYNTLNGYQLHANEILDDVFGRYNPQYLKSNLGRAEGK